MNKYLTRGKFTIYVNFRIQIVLGLTLVCTCDICRNWSITSPISPGRGIDASTSASTRRSKKYRLYSLLKHGLQNNT